MDLHFGINIIELILEINYSIKNIEFNCLLCSKYNEHRDEAISWVATYRKVKTGNGKLQSRHPKKVVAIAERWYWIYIVTKCMFKGKKGQWRHQNYLIIKDKRKTERKSSRLIDAKRLFQEIKSVSFFHISAVLVRTGVCAYIDGTLLLILFKRYKVSTIEIHLDSVDNLSPK